jgi:hypothetical protein
MKIIAFYLPQFHETLENNEWWGKGFTEWVNMKKVKPLFRGHYQPRVPLNNNYYDLSDIEVMKWQTSIAQKYGVYGFCFYHYWFDGHLLLQKPVEQFLDHTEIDFPFCISWANEAWTKAWVSKSNHVLIEQYYGNKKEWKEHFYYLLPYFKDKRYIKHDGKPLLTLYRPELVDCLNDMLDYWQQLAIDEGMAGIEFAYQHIDFENKTDKDDSRFSYNIEYQPLYAQRGVLKSGYSVLKNMKNKIINLIDPNNKWDIWAKIPQKVKRMSYDEAWEYILSTEPSDDRNVPGAFVDWDNTPRKVEKGSVYVDATPEKFQKYIERQIVRAREVYHQNMLFLFAWNEWAEGGYMEPDERYGYAYLEALKKALDTTGEFPSCS